MVTSIEQGRYVEAEKLLRTRLLAVPDDSHALNLLGVVLDTEKKFEEAEAFYLKALKLAPRSVALLNNLGNHFLAQGTSVKACEIFKRVLELDPAHSNANLQLARIYADQKDFPAAARQLKQLLPSAPFNPSLLLLRARILHGTGQEDESRRILANLEAQSGGDLSLLFSIGLTYVAMEQFAEAERIFSRALGSAPSNFELLYNLGTAALRAGHLERAAEAYQRALEIKPDDYDCLVGMGRTLSFSGKDAQAVAILLPASQKFPSRPDLYLLLADSSGKLGFYSDSALAYDHYLKLKPEDDLARRDRGFALVCSSKVEEGMRDLEWYVRKHPQDPEGFFRLAIAQSMKNKEAALDSISHVLKLNPRYIQALFARGSLYLQLDRPDLAVQDLKSYLELEPKNTQALDQMGRALLRTNQAQEAAACFEKAISLSPENPGFYFQYSRALRALGRTKEMSEVLARFEQLGGSSRSRTPTSGLFDFFNLSPAQQQGRYLDNLRQAVAQHPENMTLKIRVAEAYFHQGKTSDALSWMAQVQPAACDPSALRQAGRVLLQFQQYQMALSFLESTVRDSVDSEETILDYILAVYHTAGVNTALAKLDQVEMGKRGGNYYLLRAQIEDSAGHFDEAVNSLNRSLGAAPSRPDLYREAALFLVKHEKLREALDLLQQAEKYIAPEPDLMFLKAIILEFLKFSDDANKVLTTMESTWPELPLPYMIHGIILQNQHQAKESKQLLETALALGLKEPAAYYYLSLSLKDLDPRDDEGAYRVIQKAIELDPRDPFFQAQAGKLALAMKDYGKALGHLEEALHVNPEMVEAHWTMANLYRATGDEAKQKAELAEVNRLNKLHPPGMESPIPMRDLFFSVGLPEAGKSAQ